MTRCYRGCASLQGLADNIKAELAARDKTFFPRKVNLIINPSRSAYANSIGNILAAHSVLAQIPNVNGPSAYHPWLPDLCILLSVIPLSMTLTLESSKDQEFSSPLHQPYNCTIPLLHDFPLPFNRLSKLERETKEQYISISLAAGLMVGAVLSQCSTDLKLQPRAYFRPSRNGDTGWREQLTHS